MRNLFLSILLSVVTLNIWSQNKEREAVVFDNAILISPSYAFQLPLNDMFHSYGFNHNLGMEVAYKFGANWLIGVEGNFLFGSIIKDADYIKSILTKSGHLIGTNGTLEEINLSERGMNLMVKFGNTIRFGPKNPNSGLLLKFGVGYIDHKIFLDVNEKNVPQLSKEIKTGYDRFTSGIAFSQYIGLIRLERKQFLNLAFGIEATEGITQNRRPYDFATGQKINKTRFDFLIGFKFNWYLPVFMGESSSKTEYYYY